MARFRKAIFPIGLIVGFSVFVVGCLLGRTDDGTIVGREGLEAVQPVNTAEAQFRQTLIVADLAFGFEGTLKVNNVTIPTNQLEPADGLNKLAFRPADGKVVTALRARQNCAEVSYWPLEQGPADGQIYRWCFNVV